MSFKLDSSSESDEIEDEGNIKTSKERTKTEESEDKAGSGKSRDRVEIGKNKCSTDSEDRTIIEDFEGNTHCLANKSKRRQSPMFHL